MFCSICSTFVSIVEEDEEEIITCGQCNQVCCDEHTICCLECETDFCSNCLPEWAECPGCCVDHHMEVRR